MATLDVQVIGITADGLTPTLEGATEAGDDWVNTGKEFLHIKNSGAQATVTVAMERKCSQGFQSEHNVDVVVPATTGWKMAGPFSKDKFNDANGKAQITYSAHETITIGVVRLP